MTKYPVLIDTDPGVDDAFAIMLAKASEELDIKAITVTAGNVGLKNTLNNALGLSDLLNIDVPVYKGADKPLIVELRDAADIHGSSGLGGYVFEEIKKKEEKEYAWDGIYKTAKESNGNLTIIALGPLTNIAIALLKYPDLPKLIKRVVIMGGSFSAYGNCVPYSEFNFWIDPHAAEIVIKSELNTEIYGLDTTRQGTLTKEELGLIKSSDAKIEGLIRHMEEFDTNRALAEGREVSFHMPDAVAMAAAITPEIFKLEEHYVTCITNSGLTQGWTLADESNRLGRKPNTKIALSVDKEKYFELVLRINTLRGEN